MEHWPHSSVLKEEVIAAFSDMDLRRFVDGTLGAGGHSEGILETHEELEILIGIDQDPQALAIAKERLKSEKVHYVHGNFRQLSEILKKEKISQVDGILLDLGVSSMQLDIAEKGFSFMNEGPLDMRMDPTSVLTAEIIVNEWPQKEIERVIREFGEEIHWRKAAAAIVKEREKGAIRTTKQLAELLFYTLKRWNKKKIHPATLTFQGLRIAVNSELKVLEEVLPQALEALSTKGRLAIITFHSLEDRIVKNYFREAASDKMDTRGLGQGLFLSKEPIVALVGKSQKASDEEIGSNARSRSARLRVVEKL